jgi:predicted restriction endonuclease
MPHKDPEERKKYQAAYRASHKEEIRVYLDEKKVLRAAHQKPKEKQTKAEWRIKRNAYLKEYRAIHKENFAKRRAAHKEQRSTSAKLYSSSIRNAVLSTYGSKCTCCGETENHFLTIDHINGGGSQHRKELKGRSVFKWLLDHGCPEGFQILCYNCNMAKGHYGICPHQLEKEK